MTSRYPLSWSNLKPMPAGRNNKPVVIEKKAVADAGAEVAKTNEAKALL